MIFRILEKIHRGNGQWLVGRDDSARRFPRRANQGGARRPRRAVSQGFALGRGIASHEWNSLYRGIPAFGAVGANLCVRPGYAGIWSSGRTHRCAPTGIPPPQFPHTGPASVRPLQTGGG